jgi:hypothetical protein
MKVQRNADGSPVLPSTPTDHDGNNFCEDPCVYCDSPVGFGPLTSEE